MRYTLLEKFSAFALINQINEFELITLFKNFKILKENELYEGLLSEYNFDEKGISEELTSDILTSVLNKDAILLNDEKYIYFQINYNQAQNIINTIDDKKIYLSFMDSYKNLLIEQEKSKTYSLK